MLSACTNNNQFNKSLSYYMKDSPKDVKATFNKMYTFETAEKEGRAYCDKLASGETMEKIMSEESRNLAILVSQNKITLDQSVAIGLIQTYIQSAGTIAYCPQYK